MKKHVHLETPAHEGVFYDDSVMVRITTTIYREEEEEEGGLALDVAQRKKLTATYSSPVHVRFSSVS